MTRLWLAAILGVLLGVGIAYTTSIPVTSPPNTYLPKQSFEVQRQVGGTSRPVQSDSLLALISLLAGIVVAAPVFVVAKART
jgi:hypothetical protein